MYLNVYFLVVIKCICVLLFNLNRFVFIELRFNKKKKLSTTPHLYLFVSFKIVSKSVPITTKVLSSNPVNREVYSIQHYHLCDKVCQ